MIVCFLVDTSVSMAQRTASGQSVLDCAKALIEHFLKVRGHTAPLAMRHERYFLITTGAEPHTALRAIWGDSFSAFLAHVRRLQAHDLSDLGGALRTTFDVLNQHRLANGTDSYAHGRHPGFMEPTLVICLTDGGALTATNGGVAAQLQLPQTNEPGSEFTREPFRWDQRLFALVLPLAATGDSDAPLAAHGAQQQPLAPMCEVTGGQCLMARSMRAAQQHIEQLATRHMTPGVSVHLAPLSTNVAGAEAFANGLCRKLYVRSGQPRWWPIPEAYGRDALGGKQPLPTRVALPQIRFALHESNPAIPDNFPFDKYELEPSPLVEHMLRATRGGCYPCYVPGSASRGAREEPFGYLKASTTAGNVSLFVLPYNYPRV